MFPVKLSSYHPTQIMSRPILKFISIKDTKLGRAINCDLVSEGLLAIKSFVRNNAVDLVETIKAMSFHGICKNSESFAAFIMR